jgi:hypothetical protein
MIDNDAPATKADINGVIESIGNLYDATEQWKDEILESTDRWKDEIIRHFDAALENIRHDLEGANRDEIKVRKDSKRDHEERIDRLEKRVGVSDYIETWRLDDALSRLTGKKERRQVDWDLAQLSHG